MSCSLKLAMPLKSLLPPKFSLPLMDWKTILSPLTVPPEGSVLVSVIDWDVAPSREIVEEMQVNPASR